MPYAMPNEALVDVLLPAYTCQHFGKCPDATWFPSEGHVPRGFLGATRALEEVEVVMVLAEPGPPKDTKPNSEKYEHSGATRALEEVEVVMVLAEPGPPKDTKPNSEKYEHTMTRRRRWSA